MPFVTSADGKYVAFRSGATNLVPNDTNARVDIFRKDLTSFEVLKVSADANGVLANGTSDYPSISADGRYVAFSSLATNLVPGDTNSADDIFRKDMMTGAIVRVSTDASGGQAAGGSSFVTAMTGDGRYVAFASNATNLAAGDTNGVSDLFLKDLDDWSVVRVNTDSAGGQTTGPVGAGFWPSVSADGRYVAFQVSTPNLVPGDTNGKQDVFVKDLSDDSVVRASTSAGGDGGNNLSAFPALSADGRFVAFTSQASNLVPGDTNAGITGTEGEDIFVVDFLPANHPPLASPRAVTVAATGVSSGQLAGTDPDGHAITFARATDPAYGSVVVNPDGSFTYTPGANFGGTDSFTFTVNDGTATSGPATVVLTLGAVAGSRTWDGGGGADANWTTAANWVGNVAPAAGDYLVFEGTPQTTTNDFPAGTAFAGFDIRSQPTNGTSPLWVFQGNEVVLGGVAAVTYAPQSTGSSAWGSSFDLPVRLAADATVLGGANFASLNFRGAVDTAGFTLTVRSHRASVGLDGVVSGAGGLVKAGDLSILSVRAANTYTGPTVVSGGSLYAYHPQALGTAAAGTTVSGGGSLSVSLVGGGTVAEPLVVEAGRNLTVSGAGTVLTGPISLAGDLWGSNGEQVQGAVTLTGPAASLQSSGAGGLVVSGAISGPYGLKLNRFVTTHPVILSGANTYTGVTGVDNGSLQLTGSLAGSLSVSGGVTVTGTGVVGGSVGVSPSGTVAPGVGGVGTLTAGAMFFSPGSSARRFEVQLAAGGNDKLDVSGAVQLNNATLVVTALGGFVPAQGDLYVLIQNGGTDAIQGTFLGMAEGATVMVAGVPLKLSYVGGDGNDATLSAPQPNRPPVATPQSVSTAEDTAKAGQLTGTDPDAGATLTYAVVQPAHGAVTWNANTGAFTYTPHADYHGTDSFTFTVSDGTATSTPAAVTVTVTPVADTRTWDGDSTRVAGGNNHWSTPANWVGDVAPEPGDHLVFDGTPQATHNDFDDDTAFDSITIASLSHQTRWVLAGQRVAVAGEDAILFAATTAGLPYAFTPSVDLPLRLAADATVRAVLNPYYASLDLRGGIDTAGHTVTFRTDNSTIFVNGAIGGAGGLTYVEGDAISGNGNLILHGDNTYAGLTTIRGGGHTSTLLPSAFGADTAGTVIEAGIEGGAVYLGNGTYTEPVTVGDRTNLILNGSSTVYAGPIRLVGYLNGRGGAVVTGDITLAGGPHAIWAIDSAPGGFVIAGTIREESAGQKLVVGGHPVRLTGSATHTGRTDVYNEFWVDGSLGGGLVQVYNSGTLSGTGVITAPVMISPGGRLAPGAGGPGTLYTGGVQWAPNQTVPAQLVTELSAGGHDRVAVAGAVDLGGATLALTALGGFVPAAGQVFTLVDNDGTDAVAGTFAGLPEGATVTVAGVDLVVSYAGGDGNDVTLAAPAPNEPPAGAADAYEVDEDNTLALPAPGVLGNDTDPEGGALTAFTNTGPAYGTLALNSDGSFEYTPDPDFHGTDSFTYRVSDGTHESAPVLVTLTVHPVNDAPVATPGAVQGDEDSPVHGAVTAADADGDALTYAVLTYPAHGALALDPDGTFTYTPDPDFHGEDAFTFVANDGQSDSLPAEVVVTVRPANDAPTADDASFTTDEDAAYAGQLTAADPDGDGLTYAVLTSPAHGTLTLNPDGSFTYTPDADFYGDDSFTYTATDGAAGSNAATVAITVLTVNDAPVAVGASFTTDEDVAYAGQLTAADPDGDGLAFEVFTPPAHGALTLNPDGTFLYVPDPDYHGEDSFTYHVTDGTGYSAPVEVAVTVLPVNDAPTADDLADATDEDVAYAGQLTAADPDGDGLTFEVSTPPAHGTLVLNPDGSFTYTPAPDFHGEDWFQYTATDGAAGSNVATVTITVQPVNDAPVVAPLAFSTDEDVAYAGAVTATDVEGDPVTVELVTGPAHGTLTLNPDGTFVYVPDPDYHGEDAFVVWATDGSLTSDPVEVAIAVVPVNDAPTADDAAFTTDEDVAYAGQLTAADVDGDTLTYAVLTPPAHGTLTLNADGSFTYAPDADYHGTDSFQYTVSDGAAGSNVATVAITVVPVNDVPTADDAAVATDEDVAYAGQLTAADVDRDALTYAVLTSPAHGALTLNPDGSFTYTPDPDFHGEDAFTFVANDGQSDSLPAEVVITVLPVNDAPTADDAAVELPDDGVAALVLGGSDPETAAGDLVFTVTALPAAGTVLLPDGTPVAVGDAFPAGTEFVYRLDAAFGDLADTLQFTVTDTGDPAGTPANALTGAPGTVTFTTPAGSAGVLRVGGSDAADALAVSPAGSDLQVTRNGVVVATVPAAWVAMVRMFGRGGADRLQLTGVAVPAYLHGGGGADEVRVGGTGGADRFQTLSVDSLLFNGAAVETPEAEAVAVDGLGGDDTLAGPEADPVEVAVGGLNAGAVAAHRLTFAGVENLAGGSAADVFAFAGAGRLTGRVDAGDGPGDRLDYAGYGVAAAVGLQGPTPGAGTGYSGTATGLGGGFSGVEAVRGSGFSADAVTGPNLPTAWVIGGGGGYFADGSFEFDGVERVTGGAAADTFTLASAGGAVEQIAGGAGVDTVVGADGANAWVVTGVNAGTVNGLAFGGVENLTGGAGADAFQLRPGGTAGLVDGGAGADRLDYSAYATAVAVNLQTAKANGVTGFAGIEAVTGGAGADTLTGPDAASVWLLTGTNAGEVGGFAFAGVENLTGGSQADDFYAAGTWTGLVNGGLGADALYGPDAAAAWVLTGAAAGTLNGARFGGVEALLGGAGDDTFAVRPGGTVGLVDGGGGADRLDYSAYATAVAVNLATGKATGVGTPTAGGFARIEAVTGGTGSDTLTGPDADSIWQLAGTNAGSVGGVAFAAVENLTGGAGPTLSRSPPGPG